MRSVYRATDTNLARQVAIKVLPESMAADAERLARFDREAKTLAALSHPNMRVAASGGDPVSVTTLQSGQSGHRFPQFLPDGRAFLFYVAGRGDSSGIYFASLDGRAPKRLTTADTAGAFLPPDRLVFVRDGLLLAQRFDFSAGELAGEPVTLAVGVGADARGRGGFSVSSDGRVAYRTGSSPRSQLTWRTRSGEAEIAAIEPSDSSYLELSPEGKRVAVQRVVNNNLDIWLTDLERGGSSRFTYDTGNDQLPTWSPDGAWIAFSPYAVSVDGRFLINEPVESPTAPITLLLNWRP